jgi:hypothetical protein
MSKASELRREREVAGFLQSWQVAQGSSLNVALNVESIAKEALHGTGYTPKGSPDTALAAFAQLAVYRLDVKRCMISLIDGSYQHILAEATQKLNLGKQTSPMSPGPANEPTYKGEADTNDLWRTYRPLSWCFSCAAAVVSRWLGTLEVLC